MNNETLLKFLMNHSSVVRGPAGNWQCIIDEVSIICMTDENADRMRFMSSINLPLELDHEILIEMMEANFHSALDARLAMHEGTIWALFLSPLSLLTEEVAGNGLKQVITLARNASCGDFHSGQWQFMGK